MTSKFIIARRAAKFFHDGDVVNLGIGIPGACAEFSEDGVMFETENGYLGCGAKAEGLDISEGYCNASGVEFIPVRGSATLTSAQSFGMIRGGRVDAAVLGGLQVSEQGDLANWGMPGRAFGMGGAMDLVNGAKKVIIAMEMLTRKGEPKIVKKCSYLLTGVKCVDYIVTEYCVIRVSDEGLVLEEIAPGYTPEDIQKMVEPTLILADEILPMYEEGDD